MRSLCKYTIKFVINIPLQKLGHHGGHDYFFLPPTSQNSSQEQIQMKDGQQTDLQQKTVFFVTPGLTGARLFLLFPELDRLQQGRPSFSCSSTYCTSPTSTTSEKRTVVRGAVSTTADEATVSALNQRSRGSLTAFLRETNFSRHDFKSAITGPASTTIAPKGQT